MIKSVPTFHMYFIFRSFSRLSQSFIVRAPWRWRLIRVCTGDPCRDLSASLDRDSRPGNLSVVNCNIRPSACFGAAVNGILEDLSKAGHDVCLERA